MIHINPSKKFNQRASQQERVSSRPIRLRAIRLESPEGVISVLLTNLPRTPFTRKTIIDLYFKRWAIEEHYRDEKVYLDIEAFHSKTPNGILQELFAVLIMSVISRTLMVLSASQCNGRPIQPQFKHTMLTLASEACVLVSNNPNKAYEIFNDILQEIKRVKYYRPKTPRKPQPRVSKTPMNKWREAKIRKIRGC